MSVSRLLPTLAITALAAAACSDAPEPVAPDLSTVQSEARSLRSGGVYVLSNDAGGNEVLTFHHAPDGSLQAGDPVATGGLGTGGGLGSQGALAMTGNGTWLLAVNPGSHDVSVLRAGANGLQLMDRVASGGTTPISVAVHGDLVYVLNAGVPETITGFHLSSHGELTPIAGSARGLSGSGVGPAQVGFTPDGRALVVTEKGTNQITTFTVHADGTASSAMSTTSAGQTPFGFAFDRQGNLVVSEAFGGAGDASTASSYRIGTDGSVSLTDGPLALTETAACWVAISQNGRFAYTTNTGSASVTGVSLDGSGSLSLLDADGVTASTGAGPIDADFSQGGRYLYVLAAGGDVLNGFAIDAHGGLTAIGSWPTPDGAAGVAAW
jgi:6-phosphogluconolactonase (cycloisomerase 2 family)